MKINQPIGDAMFGPFFLRIPLGAYFALAGWTKLNQFAGFIDEVKQMHILPDNIATLYATILPYIEVFVGGCLFLGLWITLASTIATLLLLSFVIAFGLFSGDNTLFNKDIILLGSAISLLFTGCGRYGFDNVRRNQ